MLELCDIFISGSRKRRKGKTLTINEARTKAQRVANGGGNPAYIVRVTQTGALMVVLFPTAAVEVIEVVQPEEE